MPINLNQELTEEQKQEILKALKVRFDSNMHRHPDINWEKLQAKLEAMPGIKSKSCGEYKFKHIFLIV